ncbi:hypothetical protein ACP4OV_013567 [Aristida adscensionis]
MTEKLDDKQAAAMAAATAAESGDAGGGQEKAGATTTTTTTTITLISSDNERFDVAEAAARLSQTVANMADDGCTAGGIPLPNVPARVLAKVLEYCNKHAAAAAAASGEAAAGSSSASAPAPETKKDDGDLKGFDKAFIDVRQDMLYDLLLASNYLEVKGLLELCCQKVADMIKGRTPEEIREMFGMENDFSPEEYEEIRKENPWAFE